MPTVPAHEQNRLITRPFIAVTLAVFVFFVYAGVLVPILPTYVEDELRGGELGVGLAIASFAVAAIAARPLIGRLVERYGRRAMMIGGGLVAAASGAMLRLRRFLAAAAPSARHHGCRRGGTVRRPRRR